MTTGDTETLSRNAFTTGSSTERLRMISISVSVPSCEVPPIICEARDSGLLSAFFACTWSSASAA
ncbi:hypothetical protein D3C81_628250 [compost metagenome]